jgi:acetyl-CoA acetyltransferase
MDKMNIHGGSLSIGHPFGATGARLVAFFIYYDLNDDMYIYVFNWYL